MCSCVGACRVEGAASCCEVASFGTADCVTILVMRLSLAYGSTLEVIALLHLVLVPLEQGFASSPAFVLRRALLFASCAICRSLTDCRHRHSFSVRSSLSFCTITLNLIFSASRSARAQPRDARLYFLGPFFLLRRGTDATAKDELPGLLRRPGWNYHLSQ